MSGPLLGLPLSALPSKLKNKRVLLLDASRSKRDLRAESMRKLGMEVDCAADVSEARSWWRADLYSLVLIDTESELGRRERFCDDMRRAKPQQQISFLVGKPGYLADAPNADRAPRVSTSEDQAAWGDVKTALAAELPGGVVQRWGILEASRRISAVRSLSHARSQATQDRPMAPRDLETRESKRAAASRALETKTLETRTLDTETPGTGTPVTRTLDDLLREELR